MIFEMGAGAMIWRYLAAAIGGALFIVAGYMFVNGPKSPASLLPAAPAAQSGSGDGPLPDGAPEASAKTREQKRFRRYDKDKDGSITRPEYLASRRKAYAKLDTNGDGLLSFDEWAIKTTTKFADADADHNGAMSPAEFATTAPKRSTRPRPKCPPLSAEPADEG